MSTADAPLPTAPALPGRAPKVLVVRAPYYTQVVDGLRDGALRILHEAKAEVEVVDVSGALEMAAAVLFAVKSGRGYDGYVVLGCVIEGETDHYEHVCREAMSALTRVTLDHALFNRREDATERLLTLAQEAQALARSGADGFNKGAEAAVAALVQIRTARHFGIAG